MITSITPTEATRPCPECPVCGETGSQETENTGECLAGDYISSNQPLQRHYFIPKCVFKAPSNPGGKTTSNSSLLEFYNEVMTFNDSVVELVCCKLDGTPVPVSCGKGLSCAAACYSEDAVLCPSHNCEDCDNVDAVSIVDEKVIEQRNEGKGGWSWATQFSGKMKHCPGRGCRVDGRFKYCCFHPHCRKQKRRQCSWFQYFLGKWRRGVFL